MAKTLDELKAERDAARADLLAAGDDYWAAVSNTFRVSPRNEVDYSAARAAVRDAYEKRTAARIARDAANKAYSKALHAKKAKTAPGAN